MSRDHGAFALPSGVRRLRSGRLGAGDLLAASARAPHQSHEPELY